MPHETPHNATSVTYAIGKVEVPVVARYAEGYTLNANEAAALNQLIQENTRNNLHQKWKKEDEKGEGKSVAERLEEAVSYQTEYQFGVRRSGRPTSVVHDPVRAEARNIIIRAIKAQLQKNGKSIKGKAEAINKQAEALLDSDKAFVRQAWDAARDYVAKMQEVGNDELGDLSALESDPAPVAEAAE